MRLVLDTSAAIEVVLNRGKAAKFAHLLEEADETLAPDLFISEVVNTVWKYHHFENLSLGDCDRSLALALGDGSRPHHRTVACRFSLYPGAGYSRSSRLRRTPGSRT